jgi:anti-sigma regulatory factor (Ser/Thr protein kinase)
MTLELPGAPIDATVARQIVRCSLDASGVKDADMLDLIVSELVTNAIAHTDSDITMTLTVRNGGGVLVEVADKGEGWPVLADGEGQRTCASEGGYGLRIVESLSSSWGCVEHLDRGKTVWAEALPSA